MLFSEPKIPQSLLKDTGGGEYYVCFSALQRAENSSMFRRRRNVGVCGVRFSALQRAENSSMLMLRTNAAELALVSVLFSEPKIPQYAKSAQRLSCRHSFSALQRAENSSIADVERVAAEIQPGFSALQRAENSSIAERLGEYVDRGEVSVLFSEPKIPQSLSRVAIKRERQKFQCSSASRKFLNSELLKQYPALRESFSALQRAENSSIRNRRNPHAGRQAFQCSSASRKFLNQTFRLVNNVDNMFQCSSASRKFLNTAQPRRYARGVGFSALQRAENSSIPPARGAAAPAPRFQCSSASRKFLNATF